jgi:hypothetical protein
LPLIDCAAGAPTEDESEYGRGRRRRVGRRALGCRWSDCGWRVGTWPTRPPTSRSYRVRSTSAAAAVGGLPLRDLLLACVNWAGVIPKGAGRSARGCPRVRCGCTLRVRSWCSGSMSPRRGCAPTARRRCSRRRWPASALARYPGCWAAPRRPTWCSAWTPRRAGGGSVRRVVLPARAKSGLLDLREISLQEKLLRRVRHARVPALGQQIRNRVPCQHLRIGSRRDQRQHPQVGIGCPAPPVQHGCHSHQPLRPDRPPVSQCDPGRAQPSDRLRDRGLRPVQLARSRRRGEPGPPRPVPNQSWTASCLTHLEQLLQSRVHHQLDEQTGQNRSTNAAIVGSSGTGFNMPTHPKRAP